MKDLKIGDWVVFDATVKVGYERGYQREVHLKPNEISLRGQVAGIAIRYTGKLVSGSTYDFEDYDQGYLENAKRIQFWEVKLGMTNKPILVRDEDIRFATYQGGKLPVQYQHHSYKERMELAKIMAKEMENWPRDEKGRWLKNGSDLVTGTQEEVSR